MDFVVLQSFPNYIEAHIAMGRLEEEGVRCWLMDENTITINPILTNAIGGIKLMVAKTQFERATSLLEEFRLQKRNTFVCPQCGSSDIESIHSPRKAVNWFSALTGFFLGDLAIGASKTWRCFSCHAEFAEPSQPDNTEQNSQQPI